jgi:uncharacterized protein (DUF58 family)
MADLDGAAVLISDLWTPDHADLFSALAAETTEATVLHLVDPAEALPEAGGALALRDRESGEHMQLTVTPAIRRRYAERFSARTQALAASCAALGIRYMRVQTDVAPLDVLLQTFHVERAAPG